MEDLAACVMTAIKPYGMTAAASGFVSGPKAASGNPFHFANWPKDWFSLYIAEEYLLADPVPRWARNSGRALTWSELFNLLLKRDPGRKVIEAARQFGFTEGLVVPTRSGDNALGLVSFGGQRDILMAEEVLALTIIARGAFNAADSLENLGPTGRPSPILTKREIECLSLLVRGHSDREIGMLLGLSVRTVRFHQANAREKFNAASRTHLAALVVAQGYVAF